MARGRMPLTERTGIGFGKWMLPFPVWLQRCNDLYSYYEHRSMPLMKISLKTAYRKKMQPPEVVRALRGDRREYETNGLEAT